jgi:putative membrane-bound dehydrogenase-like protein
MRGHLTRFIAGFATVAMAWATWAERVRVNGKEFTLPDGFVIELAASSPVSERPIVADFDERGRLYVAESSGSSDNVQKQLAEKPHRIARLEDTDGDGKYDQRVVFADRMMFPEGAMWHDGSLYVAAPPSIWKLTDTDDDGVADRRVEWFKGLTLTGCANDLHGPYLGLDGWIYWCKGAFAKQTYERPGKKPLVTRAAHIFRARPDGSGVEPVMTGGMDNPVEVVFTPTGERIFTTTFFQHPGGGKRDGLVHAVYGGVYGKVHDVIDDPSHVRTGPEVMPVLSHLGPAAPSGLYRFESDAFGREYRDNLFTAAFNLHKIVRHELTASGATFSSKDSEFLVCDDLDFHPTDVLEDADGSLLVLDTGGWYKLCCPTSQLHKPDIVGAIYRVRRTGAAKMDDPRGLKLGWEKMTVAELAGLLGDVRPVVRKRAMAMLPKREGAVVALSKLMDGAPSAARVNGVWTATRIDGPDARALVRRALAVRDDTARHAAIHSAGLWRDKGAVKPLLNILSSAPPQLRRAAAEALGRIGDGAAVPSLLAAVRQTGDPVLEHSLIYALIEIADPALIDAQVARSNDPAIERAALIALDQMEHGGLRAEKMAAFLTSPDAPLRETATWVAGRHPEWGDALAGAFAKRITAPAMTDAERADLQRQLARLAKSPAIQALLTRPLQDADAPAAERQIALGAIAQSGLKETPKPWLDALAGLLPNGDPALTSEVVATVRRLNPKREASAPIIARLHDVANRNELPAATRHEALAAVPGGVGTPAAQIFDFLLAQLGAEQPVGQRMSAADVLAKSKLSKEQLIALAKSVGDAGPLEIQKLLGPFENASDDDVGLALVQSLKQSKALTSLREELIAAKVKKFGPEVQAKARELYSKLNPDAAAQKATLERMLTSLPPGDVRRGQAVFHSTKAACASCHAIGYLGGTVGPDLTKIGSIRQERDLLEAIVFPSASFVQSYEPLIVETGDDVYGGVPRGGDAGHVVLASGPGPEHEIRIPRGNIKSQRPGQLSIMPAGLDQQLTEQELADLVAFLKACR